MSEQTTEDFSFEYDDSEVAKSDKNAAKITDGGAYVGQFPVERPPSYVEADSGAKAIEFEFETEDGGKTNFTVWMIGKTGQKTFGYAQVMGLCYLMDAKLKAVPGKVMRWVDGEKGRVREEVDGMVYPDLAGKRIGLILEKELTGDREDNPNGDKYRFNLFGAFDPKTKLTATELKERKTRPEKFDKYLKALRVRDSRKKGAAEPSQPSMGLPAEGGY